MCYYVGSAEVSRKPEESLNTDEFPQVKEEMVAHHQDDGQASQEVYFPDALSSASFFHGGRILRAPVRNQPRRFLPIFQVLSSAGSRDKREEVIESVRVLSPRPLRARG